MVILILIPLLPLLGFLILGIGFRSIPQKVTSVLGSGTILGSFIFSLIIFLNFHYFTISPSHHFFPWLHIGPLDIPFSLLIDPLSVLMLLIVTGVGFLIHVYSVGYMKEDPGYNRFFAYMNLFVFFMLLLVMGPITPSCSSDGRALASVHTCSSVSGLKTMITTMPRKRPSL